MLRRSVTRRRSAATLVEVVIGFGILGVAATSLATLPIFSAITVSNAMKEDRTTTAALAADSLVRDWHKKYVVEPGDSRALEQYHYLMDNPQLPLPTNPAVPMPPVPTNSTMPSYPVYLDPMGVAALRGDVGGVGMVPRTTARVVLEQPAAAQQRAALRFCSLLDGLKLNEDGIVAPPPAPTYDMRDMRYNFAWMLQRMSNRDRLTVRQQVVVYDRRVHLYAPPGSEAAYTASFNPGDTQIVGIPATAEVRKGTWVLDVGYSPPAPPAPAPPNQADPTLGLRQAEFYRVVSVIDNGTGYYTLEVHKPIVRSDKSTAAYTGVVIVIPSIADVFERPPLTAGFGP
jgi:hypothetical protein